MLYFSLYVQLRRGSVAGYTTDESWAYGPKKGVEAFESITWLYRYCPWMRGLAASQNILQQRNK